jgi:SNF family Na+-dependent transporter
MSIGWIYLTSYFSDNTAKSFAKEAGLHETYTTLFGNDFNTACLISGVMPVLGGSNTITSGMKLSFTKYGKTFVALPSIKRIFFNLFFAAFSFAFKIACLLDSTPTTSLAHLAK